MVGEEVLMFRVALSSRVFRDGRSIQLCYTAIHVPHLERGWAREVDVAFPLTASFYDLWYCIVTVFVQVVRTVVFSSARSDTDKDSTRMQMFESMREKKFEVHMATTMGVQEKCIDIALAVEMMHYATIPDTYDVGGKYETRKAFVLLYP